MYDARSRRVGRKRTRRRRSLVFIIKVQLRHQDQKTSAEVNAEREDVSGHAQQNPGVRAPHQQPHRLEKIICWNIYIILHLYIFINIYLYIYIYIYIYM